MTQGPDDDAHGRPDEPGRQPWEPGPPQGEPAPGQAWGQQYGPPPPPQQYNPVYGGAYGMPGAAPDAPYGRHPVTGVPYSDKQKLVAGLLQVLVPLGIGRFYMGDTGIGVAQLLVTLVTCGLGALWPFIDGILILVGDKTDSRGLPLRG